MNILIVGYGSIGRRHREVLSGLYPSAKIDVVSAHSSAEIAAYRSLCEVKHLNSYDYYVIASQTSEHYQQLHDIDASVLRKVILVEKPIFHGLREFHSSRNKIYVGYNLRYHPQIAILQTLCSGHKILTVNVIVGQYLPDWRPESDYKDSYSASKERGGGVLLDLSHEIDYVQWLFGSIAGLKAIGGKVSSLDIETEDFVTFVGQTERGVCLSISLDYLSHIPIRRIYANTDDSTYICDLVEGTIHNCSADGTSVQNTSGTANRNYTYTAMHIDILEEQGTIACTLEEGLNTMRTIENVRKSMKDGF